MENSESVKTLIKLKEEGTLKREVGESIIHTKNTREMYKMFKETLANNED